MKNPCLLVRWRYAITSRRNRFDWISSRSRFTFLLFDNKAQQTNPSQLSLMLWSIIKLLTVLVTVACGSGAFVSPELTRRRPTALDAKPSIAIVGAGAVGSYYGARLWEAGVYDVKFHMRGEQYKKSTEQGLNVTVRAPYGLVWTLLIQRCPDQLNELNSVCSLSMATYSFLQNR